MLGWDACWSVVSWLSQCQMQKLVGSHWLRVCSEAHGRNGTGIVLVLFRYVYGAERAQFCLDQSKAIYQLAMQNTLMRTVPSREPDLHPACNLRPKSF